MALALLAGCASQMLSDDRLRANTAGILGVSADQISISDRVEQVPNTYYTAAIKDGRKFSCTINGGGILAAGMTNPPACAPKGQPIKNTSPFQR